MTQQTTIVNYLDKVELYATRIITTEFSDKLVFHDIEHAHTVVSGVKLIAEAEQLSPEEKEIVVIAAWLNTIGFKELDQWNKVEDSKDLFLMCSKCSERLGLDYLESITYPPDRMQAVINTIEDASPFQPPETKLGKILADAVTIELASKKGKKRLELRYQELLLTGALTVNKIGFYDALLSYLQNHEYYTDYGQTTLRPKKELLVQKVEKDRKDLDKSESQAIKKELAISDAEFKKLKKNLKSVKGRDERGIQTMFRTTSRNHYTLNQMVDRKANIMISINAIILSLILSRVIGQIQTFCIHNSPILLVLITSIASIVFALIAITPGKSHGEFTEQEIREKKGNLLYFGNYYNMGFRDYNWGMLQMLNDSDYLYTSMIRDQYFMGQILSRKYKHIRISLALFGIGLVAGVILFFFVASMPNYHVGFSNHG